MSNRKLTLSRETLRQLNPEQATHIVAGAGTHNSDACRTALNTCRCRNTDACASALANCGTYNSDACVSALANCTR